VTDFEKSLLILFALQSIVALCAGLYCIKLENKLEVKYPTEFTCTIVTKRFSQDKCAQFTSNDWIKENQ